MLARCQSVITSLGVIDYDAALKYDIDAANDRFGLMGERVLAFAKLDLDPRIFTKDPVYQFDVKNWASW